MEILTVLFLEDISMVDFLVFLIGGVSDELGQFCDTFWNTESLNRVLKSKKAAKVIAMAIAEFGEVEK